jgi:hypothetical protein
MLRKPSVIGGSATGTRYRRRWSRCSARWLGQSRVVDIVAVLAAEVTLIAEANEVVTRVVVLVSVEVVDVDGDRFVS